MKAFMIYEDNTLKRILVDGGYIDVSSATNNPTYTYHYYNQRSVALAHEFGHVILFMRGLPYGHTQPGVDSFVYGRATSMARRFGYDF
jgi:hypothetical protein